MTTLTQTSISARKIIRYGIFFILFLIVGRIFLKTGISIYKRVFPPPEPAPTVSFGKLPKVPFPERTNPNFGFSLETPEGELPKTITQAKVFYMPKISANLLSLDFAKEKFSSLNFDPNPQQINQSTYRFYHKNVPSTLETDIITGAFSISYDLASDPSPLYVRPLPPEVAAATARTFLSNANVLPADLTGAMEYQFLKQESGGLVSALSLSDASLVKIHFFRKNYDNLPVVTQTPKEANVWFIVSGLRERGKDVIAGEYHYFPVDETQFSTYPIITPEEAWKNLSEKNYYTASRGSAGDGEIVKIRRIYLAYFDPGIYTKFLQPVYVFEGDKNFVGYIPAVTSAYYETP